MNVKRIVANIAASEPSVADTFYRGILGLDLALDHGWIRTYAGAARTTAQASIASQGGSGTPVPDLSIEVDDLDEALRRVRAGAIPVEYGPTREPWGVRRFYVKDPLGRLVNILQHDAPSQAIGADGAQR
ncbi:MAG: VOC family protein [Burkholderiales bacterium]